MPTAAKLAAALVFAALMWVLADIFVPGLEGAPNVGFLREICAAVGAVCGWQVMGRLVGPGMAAAAGSGLRTAVTAAVLCFLGFSTYEMVRQSTRMVYDGPMEAILGVFEIAVEYFAVAATPGFLGTLVVGGIAAGLFSEWVHRRAIGAR